MSHTQIDKRGRTRRGFVRDVAAGAGGVALALPLKAALTSYQGGLRAAPAAKSRYEKYILAPEIKKYRDLQVFELRSKDTRGYDFVVQLSPLDAIPRMEEAQEEANADRVKAYIGGDPNNVRDLGTEIEMSMGKERETYKTDAASVVYIPKGTPFRQSVLKKSDKLSFVLTLTLPPKYVQPDRSKK